MDVSLLPLQTRSPSCYKKLRLWIHLFRYTMGPLSVTHDQLAIYFFTHYLLPIAHYLFP